MTETTNFLSANRQLLFRLFFFGVFLYLLYQFSRIFSPFVTPLLAATTLALIFSPLHTGIQKRLKERANLAAALSTVLILVIVILPVILLAWLLIKESAVVYPWAQQWMQSLKDNPEGSLGANLPPPARLVWDKLDRFFFAWQIDPQEIFLKNLDQIGRKISAFGTQVVRNTFFLVFDVMVTAFALFFFFRDGAKTMRKVMDLVPMEKSHKEMVLSRLNKTLSAVVRGVFITASVQGLLAGIGFAVAGVRFSVLLGFATAFLALIPFVGATSVWLPVSLYLFFVKGAAAKGVLLFLWGALVVSLADNFLRPILIGEQAKLPVFLLFFGILGGLQVYGFIGILMGPLMIASVLAFAKIYREQFQQKPPSPKNGAPPSTPPPPPA